MSGLHSVVILTAVPVCPLGQDPRGPNKLGLTKYSGYKFRFTNAKGVPEDLLHPGPEMSLNRHYITGKN
ncbi:hypothetical protein TNCV_4540161 [Trichonephila clavipes]|nr:hypothetical protein TNCV_4540161 [Trichonephila clavipes]